MMGQERDSPQAATISTDATVSTAINIIGANRIAIEVPDLSNGVVTATANVFFQVSNTSTSSTFKRIQDVGVYSASSGIDDWQTFSTTGNVMTLCRPAPGFSFGRVELSKTATANVTCVVHVIH